jgi:hypothetical protein
MGSFELDLKYVDFSFYLWLYYFFSLAILLFVKDQ